MRIVIVGCGRVGAGVVRALDEPGRQLVVIDRDATAFDRVAGVTGVHCHQGDAIDREVLRRARLDRTDALAVATGADEINSVVARLALRRFHVPRVVARIYDPRTADVYRRLGIRTISPVAWGIERLAQLLTVPGLAPVGSIGSGGVELVETRVSARLAERPVSELESAGEIRVVAVSRHGRARVATPQTRLEAGDIVHLAVASDSVARLAEMIGEA